MTTREIEGIASIVVEDIQDGFAALARGVFGRAPFAFPQGRCAALARLP